jgi:uncharacterized membrane protein YraQ (UPF0718 family)
MKKGGVFSWSEAGRREAKILGAMVGVFLVAYFLPLSDPKIRAALLEAFKLLQWYARNHTLACVVPALFIAGAVTTFLSPQSVLRYLGPTARKPLAYGVASVAGSVLAVCSCSVLPVFAGIYRLGAGLGPATAFLYSGPAINILAIFLSARVLGLPIGLGRGVGAVVFAVVIGLLMAGIFRGSEGRRQAAAVSPIASEPPRRSLGRTTAFMAALVAFLVFSDWYNPGDVTVRTTTGQTFPAVTLQEMEGEIRFQLKADWNGHGAGEQVTLPKSELAAVQEADTWILWVHHRKWWFAGAMGLAVLAMTWRWFERDEINTWMVNTWDFAKLLVPLLFGGVFVVGFISPLIPPSVVAGWVGDNSPRANLAASVIGAFWYFATLTEIPICEALGRLGMHPGPMLALLLAGPAVSLPNMLVLRGVMGARKTLAFVGLTIVMATLTGMVFGALTGHA